MAMDKYQCMGFIENIFNNIFIDIFLAPVKYRKSR